MTFIGLIGNKPITEDQATVFWNHLRAKSPDLLHTKICCIMPVQHLGKFVLSGWNDLRLERAGVGSDQRSLDVLCWRLEPTGQHKPQVFIPHQCRRYHSLHVQRWQKFSSFLGKKDPYFWCHKVCHKVFDTVKTSPLWQCQKLCDTLCDTRNIDPNMESWPTSLLDGIS